MPFSYLLSLFKITKQICNVNKMNRKEGESDYTIKNLSCTKKKASVPASYQKTLQASVTVEAVVCIPLFLYAAVCLIWLIELRAIQLSVRSALGEAAREMTVELSEVPILIPARLEEKISELLGEERIEQSLITDGIHCEKSYIWGNTGIIELTAEYEVRLPFPQFAIPNLPYQEKMRVKAWNGYIKGGKTDFAIGTIVYITETGVVYHKDYRCNYLDLSVRNVNRADLENLRNKDGSKYYPCEFCSERTGETVYITDYGNRYHSTTTCSGMKRKIYAVPLSEVKGKGACSKCGQ